MLFSGKNDNGEAGYWTYNEAEGWHMVRLYQDEVEPETSPSAVVVNGTPNVFFADKTDNSTLSDWTYMGRKAGTLRGFIGISLRRGVFRLRSNDRGRHE